jgi:hypothetical protein
MPRKRKPEAEVSATRRRVAHLRWDKLTPEQRREAVRPAIAASPMTKKRKTNGTDDAVR